MNYYKYPWKELLGGAAKIIQMQMVYKIEMKVEAMPSRELLPGSNNLAGSVPGSFLVSASYHSEIEFQWKS